MDKHLIIHGHFYQPPRENPWLEAVEVQDGAYPYHDWNERITDECYAPNAASRILDEKKRIIKIVSNYAKLSFDIGPTLLGWLEANDKETYRAILDADRLSASQHQGHGHAIAQAYSHMIMPLANARDKKTQVIWGIRDFEYRFGRRPEGLWLPETALDLETLDIASSMGIGFTILAPHQAKRMRKKGGHWENVSGEKVDPTRPYQLNLPSGRGIAVFFYHSPVSHAVAFERLLDSGEEFARRLIAGFHEEKSPPAPLMHIATDGESYGHHHRFGDMALAYALNYIETRGLAVLTNYAAHLSNHPPVYEVEVAENTSWSCGHGVERWRSDCGCSTGAHPGWNQQWRAPLRNALDWLRDELAGRFEKAAYSYLKDPWAAREDYIDFILERSEETLSRFLEKHSIRPLDALDRVKAVKLLELQRHAMLMYTSCGWFFDDISGIETIQILQYAGRAVQLAEEIFGEGFEEPFRAKIARANSNVRPYRDGSAVYDRFVKPAVTDLRKVCVHYAISSLYKEYPEKAAIYCYDVELLEHRRAGASRSQLLTGKCRITSRITRESEVLCFSVLHIGNHDFNCGVQPFTDEERWRAVLAALFPAFEQGAVSEVVRLMDANFGMHGFSLSDLFRDEQRKILALLLKETIEGFEASYRRIYEDNRILMGYLRENGIPVPKAFYTAAEFILNLDLKKELSGALDGERIQSILGQLADCNAKPDAVDLEFTLRHTLTEAMKRLLEEPSLERLQQAGRVMDIAGLLPFTVNTWVPQNICHRIARTVYPGFLKRTDPETGQWAGKFRVLGEKLNFDLDKVLA